MLRISAFVLTILAPVPAAAQCVGPGFIDMLSSEDQAALQATADAIPFGEGLFWQASKDGTDITILGTMHLPDPRHDALMARALPLLESADIMLVEATLEDQTDMQVFMARNPDIMSITSGPALPDLLDDATWAAVQDAASARGIPGFMAAKMEPWFLTLTLSIPPCAMASMASGGLGLDAMLMTAASANNIPTAPLEPWEDMFALMASGTQEEQIEVLEMSLLAPDLQDAMITELTDRYFSGETAVGWYMARYGVQFMPNITMEEFEASMAEFEDALLWGRNRAWIPVIEDTAATHDDIFIGFGAAHLIGEDGVLNLLAQNGWTITPL
ncbi:TraB/GumN family protein [Octadecabacter sp. G9-8]|uniref:TraB/GumN family protein n=1 Tax=Octadecabacter dasysiphoniae TaxID=2909341 RepID=A0ABS9CR65_9RHOB|nr:TraB/GumN family protein [Octadecabacter dasysiphoniae]MCF2869721.1 TraB/GumN family protein [Octadecabacter dasysiphoniae]